MNFYLVIFIFLTLIVVTFAKNIRVIGGENADIRNFPYIASLRLHAEQRHFCAGVIITNRHILTAAHCIEHLENYEYGIYVGTSNSSLFSIPYYNAKSVKIHPEFVGRENTQWKLENDIAIITLEQCIKFNQFQNKIKFPTNDIKPDDIGTIIGWGQISYPIGVPREILQKVSIKVISNNDCADSFPDMIQDYQVCLFQAYGIGTCHGDSGGPFVINETLVGISSFSQPCAVGYPDVYTKIYSYLDFILPSISSWRKYIPCLH